MEFFSIYLFYKQMLAFFPFFEAGRMPSTAQHRTTRAQSQQSCTQQQASKKYNGCLDTHITKPASTHTTRTRSNQARRLGEQLGPERNYLARDGMPRRKRLEAAAANPGSSCANTRHAFHQLAMEASIIFIHIFVSLWALHFSASPRWPPPQ